MDRRAFIAATATVATTGLAGCARSAAGPGADAEHDVGMTTNRFRPERIEVAPGTTVVWQNTSSHAHTVTAYGSQLPADAPFFASGEFDTTEEARAGWRNGDGALYAGDAYRHTFETRGEHPYFCIPHEANGMVGTVVVTDSPATEG